MITLTCFLGFGSFCKTYPWIRNVFFTRFFHSTGKLTFPVLPGSWVLYLAPFSHVLIWSISRFLQHRIIMWWVALKTGAESNQSWLALRNEEMNPHHNHVWFHSLIPPRRATQEAEEKGVSGWPRQGASRTFLIRCICFRLKFHRAATPSWTCRGVAKTPWVEEEAMDWPLRVIFPQRLQNISENITMMQRQKNPSKKSV